MEQDLHGLASPPARSPYKLKAREARFSLEERSRRTAEAPPLCACGCGKPVKWDSGRCRWRRFAARNHYRPHAPYKNPEWLRQRYVDERRTLNEIAAECDVAQSTIIKAMKKADIARRDRSASRIGRKVGELNHSWRGGVTPERQRLYKTVEWRALLAACFKRDDYHCVRCGASKTRRKGLHTHHVKQWADHPDLRLDLSNVVTVCENCHFWIHSRANTVREYLG